MKLFAKLICTVAFSGILMFAGTAAGALPPLPIGYRQIDAGFCNFAVPAANESVVEELSPVCGDAVDRIFGQLDLDRERNARTIPVKIRIVADPSDMGAMAPPQMSPPSWSGAVAYPDLGLIILALRHRDGRPVEDLSIVLEHELSHLALHDKLRGVKVPRWFSEGIAVMQSEGSSLSRGSALGWAAFGGSLMSISDLERYPAHSGKVGLAYAQAADFVGFLLRKEGWHGIRVVLHRLRQGDTFDEAFEASYEGTVAKHEIEWRDGLEGNWSWIALVTGTGALWGAITFLFIVAFFSVRRRRRERLDEMADEEAPVERMIAVVEKMERYARDPRAKPATEVDDDVVDPVKTKVEVDGEIHTLH